MEDAAYFRPSLNLVRHPHFVRMGATSGDAWGGVGYVFLRKNRWKGDKNVNYDEQNAFLFAFCLV